MNIVITAGGTSERIDNVRKITNSSTGKLGSVIAREIIEKQINNVNKIYYVCSKEAIKPNHKKIEVIDIVDTQELETVITQLLIQEEVDYFIHSMAVSDYTVDYVSTSEMLSEYINNHIDESSINNLINKNANVITDSKISSYEDNLIIKLKKIKKIISLIKEISPNTHLIGFKLLDNVSEQVLIDTAIKLKDKNQCDIVVANDLYKIRQGNHKAFIINSNNDYEIALGKEDIAKKLVYKIFKDN